MGASFFVGCRDCRLEAPPIGGGGVLGLPTLAIRAPDSSAWPTFGSVYAAYGAIGMYTREMDSFYHFLSDHLGHAITIDTEGQAFTGDLPAHRTLDTDAVPGAPPSGASYHRAYYRVACPACRISHTTSAPDDLRWGASAGFGLIELEAFIESVLPHINAEIQTTRSYGDPDVLAAVVQFCRQHGAHGLLSSLVEST